MSAANALSSDQTAKAAEMRAAEPSMEDILASIRRIIADDQSRSLAATSNAYRRAATQNVTPPPSSFAPLRPEREPPAAEGPIVRPVAPGPAAAGTVTIELAPKVEPAAKLDPAVKVDLAPKVELSRRPVEPFADGARPAAASQSFTGVRAATVGGVVPPPAALPLPHLNPPPLPPGVEDDLSVIAEIVNAGAASILAPPLPADQPAPAADAAADAAFELDHAVASAAATQAPPVVLTPDVTSAPAPDAPRPTASDPAPDGSAVLSLHGFEAAPEATETASAEPIGEPLLSSAVGASIESSFQALATSVFLKNAGAVEDMTRELIRPMLKTWLDDNLPTIVERLVRIEIERVARGGRG